MLKYKEGQFVEFGDYDSFTRKGIIREVCESLLTYLVETFPEGDWNEWIYEYDIKRALSNILDKEVVENIKNSYEYLINECEKLLIWYRENVCDKKGFEFLKFHSVGSDKIYYKDRCAIYFDDCNNYELTLPMELLWNKDKGDETVDVHKKKVMEENERIEKLKKEQVEYRLMLKEERERKECERLKEKYELEI